MFGILHKLFRLSAYTYYYMAPVKLYEEIMQEIMYEYDSNPRHWKVSLGRSHDNKYFDIVISQGPRVWQIKLDTLYKPSPLGIGARIEVDEEAGQAVVPLPFSYGLRPIPERKLMDVQSGEDLSRILEGIMRAEPVPASQIAGRQSFLQGPIAIKGNPLSPQPLSYISEKQKVLDRKLTRELNSLLFKSYSGMGYL